MFGGSCPLTWSQCLEDELEEGVLHRRPIAATTARTGEDSTGATETQSGSDGAVGLQETMRAAVVEVLSTPAVIRQLLSAVSSASLGSQTQLAASLSAHDGRSLLVRVIQP